MDMDNTKQNNRIYVAIDLKSFYASVECMDRGLDPLGVNLVVADASRTEKTICLAVSPSLKSFGIGGRARLFEVVTRVKEVNALRRQAAPDRKLTGKSYYARELEQNPDYEVDYIVARPRMARYMEVSRQIFDIYMRYIAPEDMHIYSVDEMFADVTDYLKLYNMSARELTMKMIREVLHETGITATAGVATNLFLCKIAMDIVAKHMPPDKDGVRLAELDEESFRKTLWNHKPITDFWMIGPGIARRLEKLGIYTMGDIARCSIGGDKDFYNEELLYKNFGVNAELIIDHAWGWEPCTIAAIKQCKPENRSISTGQVLSSPYNFEKGRLIINEMTDLLVLDLVEKGVVTDQMVLNVGYDVENLMIKERSDAYRGPVDRDHYGRPVPKPAHGSINLGRFTSSAKLIREAVLELYDRIVDRNLTVRRMNVVANHAMLERDVVVEEEYEQLDLFSDYDNITREREEEERFLEREKNMQKAVVSLKKRYGKNAVLKGMNLLEGATTIERNGQVGGHKAE